MSESELSANGLNKSQIEEIKSINLDELVKAQLENIDLTIEELSKSEGNENRIAALNDLKSKKSRV